MNESSQQRLDEFRAGYRHARPAASAFVAWLQILVIVVGFAGVVAILLLGGAAGIGASGARGGLEIESRRQLAAYLAQKNAFAPALDAYAEYLAEADLTSQERAKVCFAAAGVAMDGEQFERALAFLYEAEWLKPGGELQKEIDAKVMACLDRLGRSAELRTELRERAQIGRERGEVEAGDTVLAELGDRVFTLRDLDKALDKLPPPAREAMASREKKAELLKNVVAEYLLSEKARRQELDKDPEIQAMLSEQLDALMVRKLLEQEVQSKVSVTPEDIQRFYDAEKSRFTAPATAKVRVGKRLAGTTDDPVYEPAPLDVVEGEAPAGFAGGTAAVAAILALEPGQRSQPFAADEGREVVYELISKTPGRVTPLEDVRTQIERELRRAKEQEQLDALIQSLLQTHNVRLYEDRLREDAS